MAPAIIGGDASPSSGRGARLVEESPASTRQTVPRVAATLPPVHIVSALGVRADSISKVPTVGT